MGQMDTFKKKYYTFKILIGFSFLILVLQYNHFVHNPVMILISEPAREPQVILMRFKMLLI